MVKADFDLLYSGTTMVWVGKFAYPATSGLPGYQNATFQAVRDHGPVPEGLYSFPLKMGGEGHMTSTTTLDTGEGVQSLPAHFTFRGQTYDNYAWGPDRVRLTIHHIESPKHRHRNGFYLHDSTKGFSHGCIEVSPHFFKHLRDYISSGAAKRDHRKNLYLRVQYLTPDITTYGGTKVE